MPTWTFVKRPGAPTGTIKFSVADGTFTINDTTTPSITTINQDVAAELKQSPYIQLQTDSPTGLPANPSISEVFLADGVLETGGPNGSMIPVSSPGLFSAMRVYGHSYAAGGGATSVDKSYSALIAGYFGMAHDGNHAVGGSYLARDSLNGTNGGISYMATRERRAIRRAPYMSGPIDLYILNWGYEDIELGCTDTTNNSPVAQNVPVFKNSLRSAISLARSSARFYAGDKTTNLDGSISLNTSSNWTNAANPTSQTAGMNFLPTAGSHSAGYISTTTNGTAGSLTITIPGDYPGSAVCPLSILFVTDPATTAGTITASGAVSGTFDLIQPVVAGTPSNTPGTCDAVLGFKNIVCWRFTDAAIAPSNGVAQTITLTPSGLAGGTWGFAEWLIESQSPPLVVVPQLGPNGLGNPGILVFQNISATDCTAFNAAITGLVGSEFKDGNVITPAQDADLGGSGNVFGLGGTAGNTTAAKVVSSTGFGGTTSTNCQVTSVQPWPSQGAAMCEFEIVTWTSVSGSSPTWTLGGVTRGAWNTNPSAHSGNKLIDVANAAAIPNYWNDGTHPSDLGQTLQANRLIRAIRLAGRTDVAKIAGYRRHRKAKQIWLSSRTYQAIQPQGSGFGPVQKSIGWDAGLVDSANGHQTVNSVLGGIDTFYVTMEADYDIRANIVWTAGKAPAVAPASGLVGCALSLNGQMVAQNYLFIDATNMINAFWFPSMSLIVPIMELRPGDTFKILAWQGPLGAVTTLSDNPLTSGATTVNLGATAGMAANDSLRIDDEHIKIGTVASGTQLTGCTRGVDGTVAAAHNQNVAAYTGRGIIGGQFGSRISIVALA